MRKILKSWLATGLAFPLLFFTIGAQAQNPFCGEILKNGIFDSTNSLDVRANYNLAKTIHCSATNSERSEGGSIGYAGVTAGGQSTVQRSSELCASSFDEYKSNYYLRTSVRTISAAIVNAWSNCMTSNRTGFNHYITPFDDPAVFAYTIRWNNDGEPYTRKLTNLLIRDADCEPKIDLNREFNSAGTQTLCTRDPNNAVYILPNGQSGMQNMVPIELSKYEEPVPMPDSPIIRPTSTDYTVTGGFTTPNTLAVAWWCDRAQGRTGYCNLNFATEYCGTVRQGTATSFSTGNEGRTLATVSCRAR